MNKSENIANLAAALSVAQGQIQGAEKDASNPTFNSQYTTLSSVWNACRAVLSANGLSVVQNAEVLDGQVSVQTVLLHSSGEYIDSTLAIRPEVNNAHGIGSAITYARRFALASMIGIAPADDDGNAASGKGTRTQERRPDPIPEAKKVAEVPIPQHPENEEENTPESTTDAELNTRWQDVVCHIGTNVPNKPVSKYLNVKLGDMKPAQIKWLHEKWIPTAGETAKDLALIAAVKAAVGEKDGAPENTAPTTETKAETPATAHNEPETAKNESAEVGSDWREVEIHSISGAVNGRKLGEVVFAKKGELETTKPMSGFEMLEQMSSPTGIAMIQDAKKEQPIQQPNKAKAELIAAINAARKEMTSILALRANLAGKIQELGVTPEKADEILVESGLEAVNEAGVEMLRHIVANWETVSAAIKGE